MPFGLRGKMIDQVLLTRDQFREIVFERDGKRCVICNSPGQDAHHIMERRLFPDEGYYLENGATVCGPCHWKAEQTIIPVDGFLRALGLQSPILPPHLYPDQPYDKWGNPILPNGSRLRGELFDDESVRKVLAPVLHLFVSRIKYPRTYHLPFSPGIGPDDRVLTSYSGFEGNVVVVTEKMDGENITWYRDYMHARSLDYDPHPSRDRIKAMWAERAHDIPDAYHICGENLYAKHSITYNNLQSYFYVFSVWAGLNCLSWNDTMEWAELLNLPFVRPMYRGPWNEDVVMELALGLNKDTQEGLVVRVDDEFHYKDFRYKVAKYVRENHVQTHGHWMRQMVTPNKLGE